MKLTFVTNLVHHHQIPVADEFYNILGADYHYISCEKMPDWLIKGGYDPSLDRPYIIRTYSSEDSLNTALKLINESDVVIIGSAPVEWVYQRKKENKLTFHYNERWLKQVSLRTFSPRYLAYIFKHHFQFRNKNTYMLCASAFTASDVHKFGCYPHKCFKWGYMTKVEDFDVEASLDVSTSDIAPLMWCSRYLMLKHPELPIQLAARLKKRGYRFVIDMFGGGEKLEETKALAKALDVEDVVNFCGNRPNEEILREMRKHSIFLFTSDRNEGWGAVANEAMSNGCALVASNDIGAVPFLVNDGVNGCIFKSKDIDSLEEKVCYLLDNPDKMRSFQRLAVRTMQDVWSPQNAAERFLELVEFIQSGKLGEYNNYDGPASWAE